MTTNEGTGRVVRRPRKTPEQRGPVGWWAYQTMAALFLTDEQIAARIGASDATIRKFMGSPNGRLAADKRQAMLDYFREVAAQRQIPIDEPPVGYITAEGGASDGPPSAVPSTLFDLLEGQTRAFNRLAAAIERMVARPIVVPDELLREMRWLAEEAERLEPGTPSSRRSRVRRATEETPHTENPGTGRPAPARSDSTRP